MKNLKDHYKGKVADEYEVKRQAAYKWRKEHQFVGDILSRHAPRALLDVPAGTGRFWSLYQELGINATGMDISLDMAAKAKERGFHVEYGDIFTATFPDFVVCVRLMNHLNEQERAIIFRKVRGCGKIVFSFRGDIDYELRKCGLRCIERYFIESGKGGEYAIYLAQSLPMQIPTTDLILWHQNETLPDIWQDDWQKNIQEVYDFPFYQGLLAGDIVRDYATVSGEVVAGSKNLRSFHDLLDSIYDEGYREDSFIPIRRSPDDRWVFVDGRHRVSIAHYLGIESLPCRLV